MAKIIKSPHDDRLTQDERCFPKRSEEIDRACIESEAPLLDRIEETLSASGYSPSALNQWLDAAHAAGALVADHHLVKPLLASARRSPAFHEKLRRKAIQWEVGWLLSDLRLIQIASNPSKFSLVGHHLAWLKKRALLEEATQFLVQVAQIEVFDQTDIASLRRLLVREANWQSLVGLLQRELKSTPDATNLLLELAMATEQLGDDKTAAQLFSQVRELMMHDKTVAPLTSNQHRVTLHWIQRGPDVSLANRIDALSKGRQPPRFAPLINHLAARTQRLGASDIWSGYKTRDLKSSSRRRLPNDIRVSSRAATFEAALARMVVPGLVVEIGSGFGVSGMYWLSALDEMGAGRFISFEPNLLWHGVAAQNYSFVSARGQTVQGTFEENAYGTIPCSAVDILSIDAIHTPEAVSRQISLALPLLRDDSWVLIDDIRFSSQMYDYWRRLAQSPSVMSFEIDTRVGVLRGLPRVGLTQQQLHIITDAYKFQHADRD